MVNVGARFRGRRVALPAGRSVSAMLTSDDGDVRALFQQEPKIKKCAGYENMDDSAFPLLMLWTAPPPARECHECGHW